MPIPESQPEDTLVHQMLASIVSVAVIAQAAAPIEAEDVLRAIVPYIQMTAKDRLIAGAGLEASNAAFQGLHRNRARFGQADAVNLIGPDRVVVESVNVSDANAIVVLTYGPVPATQRLDCGQVVTIPLRRQSPGKWTVEEDGVWLKCSVDSPPGLSDDDSRALEAIRLAASHLHLAASDRVVAGPNLSTRARLLIFKLVPVGDVAGVASPEFVLPAGHVNFRSVHFAENGVAIELTQGPVPRHAHLACGATFNVTLQRRAGGWFVATSSVTVC